MLYILGIKVDIKPLSIEEKEIVLSWQDARNNRDFEKADELRNKIYELGQVLIRALGLFYFNFFKVM